MNDVTQADCCDTRTPSAAGDRPHIAVIGSGCLRGAAISHGLHKQATVAYADTRTTVQALTQARENAGFPSSPPSSGESS